VNRLRFTIDLARCTGCQTCSVACKDRAGLPDDLDWLRVEEHEGGAYPHPTLYYRVSHCFHCAQAPCIGVCPTGALGRPGALGQPGAPGQPEGWVQIDAGLCIACGACIEACPLGAIVMRPEGVASKCDGCADEVARGWGPTCVRACPMRALGYAAEGRSPADGALPENRVQDDVLYDRQIGPAVLYLRRPGYKN
jgi:anaerobic dimethyl sulfoxide reductase subunit B (iron-sulfur subunit)